MARLMDLATVIRSKNVGPYEITFDILFDDPEMYEQVKRTGIINRELFVRLHHVRPEEVFFTTYDAAYAFKGISLAARLPVMSRTPTCTGRNSMRHC